MASFISAMDQNTIDEKGCVAYTAKGVSSNDEGLNEDLGLVALMSKIIGTRPGKKGPKVVGTSRSTIEDLYTFVKENIDTRAVEEQQVYMNYLVKAIFKVRDIKDGNGERDIFYWLFLKLYITHPELVVATFPVLTGGYNEDGSLNSEEPFGSYLDLNKLYNLGGDDLKKSVLAYYKFCLELDSDSKTPTLASKWAPREGKKVDNESNMAHDLALEIFGRKDTNGSMMKTYRKFIVQISRKIDSIVERFMSADKWDEIDIKNICSKAFMKYMKALKNENKDGTIRHEYDDARMKLRNKILEEQKKALTNPEECKINTKTLFAYEITEQYMAGKLSAFDADSQWAKFENDFKEKLGGEDSLTPGVCLTDVSGSMAGIPMIVCITLSILLSKNMPKPWNGSVLTFETVPQWFKIRGTRFSEMVESVRRAPWGGTTDFEKALSMILEVAKRNKIPDEEMPRIFYIFSDMQWNQASRGNPSGHKLIQKMYSDAGYTMPHIVYWDLRATNTYNNKSDQVGTTMMSGFSQNMFKEFVNGNMKVTNTPWESLRDSLDTDRYGALQSVIDKCF
tara:strand:- start:3371 stop:5065 length:1695 start_codon:yes stop_codon:yes gene_type:complete